MSANKLQLLEEAERRGILPPEQKAMLDEARRRGLVGGAAPPAMAGQRAGSNFSPQNMIDDIGAVQKMRAGQEAQFGYRPDQPWEAQSSEWRLPYFKMAEAELAKEGRSQGSFRRGMDDGSYQPQQRAPGAEAIKARAMEIAKQKNFQFLPYKRPEMTQWEAGVTGANSINPLASVAVSSADRALDGGAPGYGFGPKAASRAYENAKTEAITTHPTSYRLGQVTTLAGTQLALGAGNSPQLIVSGAQKFVSPATAARLAKQTLLNQGIKLGGRVAASGAAFTGELALYNAVAEAPNRAREAGEPMPTLGQRIDYAASELDNPWGWGTGVAAPFVGRAVRAAAAGTKNLATTGTLRQAVPQPGGSPQITGTYADLFTPTDVQRRVAMSGAIPAPTENIVRMPKEEAMDRILKSGIDLDEAEKLIRLISYDGRVEVDEMFFEILGQLPKGADIDQLAVALARVGGDSQKTFRTAFKERNAEIPEKVQVALREAMGLSGDDLESFAAKMASLADEATAEGYAAAYGKQVSDETWAKIYQRLLDTTEGFSPNLTNDIPDAIAAARAGARLARSTARGNQAQLEAARQLDELAGALAGRAPRAQKLSTHALDFLDRGIRSGITDASRGTKANWLGLRDALRNSGLDAETGLNVPRATYAQYMAAKDALEFGVNAARNSVPLRNLKGRFIYEQKAADDAFEDIIGEGKSVIDHAIALGWLRGADDIIEDGTNSSSIIRALSGSRNQQNKLLEMMPEETAAMNSGDKSDLTKRIKALVGSPKGKKDYDYDFALSTGTRVKGKTSVRSIFNRQRDMIESGTRVSGNSVTGNVSEAIAAQGGMARLLDGIASAVMNPQQAARNAALWMAKNSPVFKPVIFKPEVNRELGRMLTVRGRDQLLEVVAALRARQIATGKGPKPTGGGPVPPSGPKGGGDGFAAARAQGRVTKEERAVLFGDDPGEIRSMGFDFARPRGIAPRQTRNDPFYDERLGPQGSQLNKAVEMRKNGFTIAEIADEMDVSEKHVSQLFNIAKNRGVDIGSATRATVAKDILFLKEKGLGNQQIAARTGANPDVVKSVISAERRRVRNSGEDMPGWLAKEDAKGPRPNGLATGLRTDAANATAGAGLGAFGPADSNEERARNMAVGALIGGGARRFGKAFGSEADGAVRTSGLGGGKRPRRPGMDKQARDIEKSVRKIAEGLREKGTEPKPPQAEMRVGKGMSKALGIADNPEASMRVATDMLKAGRTPEEVFAATNRVLIKVDGQTILVRAPGSSVEEVQAAFWQEMAKPFSKRAEWAQKGTEGIRPIGPNSVARKPVDERVQAVANAIRRNPSSASARKDIWEETGVVVVGRGADGQMVAAKNPVGSKFEPVALMDGAGFKTWKDVLNYLEKVKALPRDQQPKWYTNNFSEVLDSGSLRRVGKGEYMARRAGDEILRRPRVVVLTTGGALGAAGVYQATQSRPQNRSALAE